MSVREESNGTWTSQFWYRDYNGDQRHKTKRGFRTSEEAQAWEDQALADSTGTVDSSFESFFETYKADMLPRLREHTWITKEYIYRDKILPYFGKMPIDEIELIDIIRWQNKLMKRTNAKGEPYSETYLRTINNQLNAVFNHAVRFYGLRRNPCLKTQKMGAKQAEEMQFWTKDEYLRFADAIMDKPDSFYAFEILYWCGLRVGELLALTPEDFDFAKSTLSVTKSYQRLKGRDVITPPKTPKSVRTVVMPRFLNEEMSDWFESELKGEGERVFPMTKDRLHHEMTRGCRLSGVKRIRIHDLRHSHVSMLIDMGYSAVAIAERMGHESVDITFRYAHLFPDKQNEMADALNREGR